MNICPMCLKECLKFKSNSHVFPRWILKKTKKNGRNTAIVRTNIIKKNQTDIKGDFICESCEVFFGTLDRVGAEYFNDILKNNIKEKSKVLTGGSESVTFYEEEGDYIKVWKFLVSLLLRYSFYEKKYSNKIILGEKHEKRISKMLFEERIDIGEYPIGSFYHGGSKILYPGRIRRNNRAAWTFEFEGFLFEITIASDIKELQNNMASLKKEKIYIIREKEEETGNYKQFEKLIKKALK